MDSRAGGRRLGSAVSTGDRRSRAARRPAGGLLQGQEPGPATAQEALSVSKSPAGSLFMPEAGGGAGQRSPGASPWALSSGVLWTEDSVAPRPAPKQLAPGPPVTAPRQGELWGPPAPGPHRGPLIRWGGEASAHRARPEAEPAFPAVPLLCPHLHTCPRETPCQERIKELYLLAEVQSVLEGGGRCT